MTLNNSENKFFATLLALSLLAFPVCARGLNKIQHHTFAVGVIPDNAPLGLDDRDKGVEYELIVALAKQLDASFSLVPINSIREGEALLNQDKIDALICAYKESPRAASQFLLTAPYYKSGLSILVSAADNATYLASDLDGKHIASPTNSDARDFFKSIMPSVKIEVVPKLMDAVTMLKSREVQAVADERVFLQYRTSQDKSIRLLDATLSESNFVIAVNKSQTALRNELNRILSLLQTTSSATTPSYLRSLLTKYGLGYPFKEIIATNVVCPVYPGKASSSEASTSSATQTSVQPTPQQPKSKVDIESRLNQLEAQLQALTKEIKDLRNSLKK